MKNLKSFVKPVIIDLIILIIISITFSFVAGNASGFIFSRSGFMSEGSLIENLRIWMKPMMFFLPVYVVVAFLLRNSIGWLATNKGNFAKALKLIFANVIDFTVILLITLLADYALQSLFYYDIFVLLFVIFTVYQFVTVWCNGVTFGKWFFGIEYGPGNRKAIFKYAIAKIVCIIIFPVILFRLLGIADPYALFLNVILCVLIFHVFSSPVFKKPIWAYLAKISYVSKNQKLKFVFAKLAYLFLIIIIGFSSIKYINNKIHINEARFFFGINYPFDFKKYPNSKDVEPYTAFLKTQNQSPKEYILGLFEQYDIVVLQERYHSESTQWDMISEIVSDTAFINNVGNIFTEYGSAIHQNKIDTFLNTVFPNDTILEQETACLMYYMSGGFYYFIKNLNLLNSGLPDSLKVREHYCDMQIDCDDIVTFIQTKSKADSNRDSLMAQVTIDWYNAQVAAGKRNKCLVVTNYRHAHGYAGGVDYVKSHKNTFRLTQGNQGQYIWEQFPEKTAAVMQSQYGNFRSLFMPISRPSHKGKWDLAFEINQNKPVGFDFKNTPFGNDYYDLYPLRGAKTKLKYEDIFTGMIFYKPYLELKEVVHPYRRHALLQSIKTKNIDLEDPKNSRYLFYSQMFDDKAQLENGLHDAMNISLSNFVPIFVYVLLSIVSLSSMLIYFVGLAFWNKVSTSKSESAYQQLR